MGNLFKDVGINGITMKCDPAGLISWDKSVENGSPHVGKAVKISDSEAVDLVDAADEVFGVLEQVHPPQGNDTFCTITFEGFKVKVPSTGVVAAGSGLVGSATVRGSVEAGASATCKAVNDASGDEVTIFLR